MEIKSDVEENIVTRDFRLIDQVNCLVAYRPSWLGRVSSGVSEELRYARYSAKSNRCAYIHAEYDILKEPSPTFSEAMRGVIQYDDLSNLDEQLDRWQEHLREIGIYETWE